MTIKQFNTAACKLIAAEMQAAAEAIAAKHGLTVRARGGSYSQTTYAPKIEFATVSEDGQAETREATAFKLFAPSYGLKPEHLGAEFKHNGKNFRLCGFKSDAPKYPFLATGSDGRTYKFTRDIVVRALTTA